MREPQAPAPPSVQLEKLCLRFLPSTIGLLVFGAMTLLYRYGDRAFYEGLLEWWGIRPFAYPFVDTESVFLAFDCWRKGVDVFAANACMGGGWYTYSPLLLQASLPLGADDRVWFGFALGITFLLSLTAFPACRSRGECAASILAVVSTATIFALERANLDIVIFLMAVLGIWLVVRTDGWRFLGYGIFVLAAAAKFYPAVLLVLAVRERPRIAFAAGVFILAAIGLLTLLGTGNGAGSSVMVPVGNPFKDMFGARNLPLVMGLLIAPADGLSADQILEGPLALPGKILMSVMLLGTAWIASRSVRRDRTNWEVLGHAEAAFLVAGAALITGCFFAAQNVGYRAIFLLLVLPALFALSRTGKSDGGHRAYLVLIIGVVLLMWEEFFHHLEVMLQPAVSQIILPQSFEFGFWLGRELLWWWVIARLIALLAAFGLSSPFFLNLRRLTERSRQGNRSFRA